MLRLSDSETDLGLPAPTGRLALREKGVIMMHIKSKALTKSLTFTQLFRSLPEQGATEEGGV